MKDEKYNFKDLLDIVEKLRSDDGCPWDREQTHESLKRHMVEEAYEAVDAINSKQDSKIREELGDVLLQVVMHARIAEEEKRFGIDDVTDGISRKLISRHTHVFGDDIAENPEEVLKNWDRIKNIEKGGRTHSQRMDDIPGNYPALLKSLKVQECAAKAGFDWDSKDGALEKVLEEIGEFAKAKKENNKKEMEKEIGDLLFSLVNVCRFMDMEPETALQETNARFVKRFRYVEKRCEEEGLVMEKTPLETLDSFWDEAKERYENET
jgi:tetrapyrrole methylase family protein/MazG family protein